MSAPVPSLLAVALATGLVAAGCKKDAEAPPPPPPTGVQAATAAAPLGAAAPAPAPSPRPGFVPMTVGMVRPSLQGGYALSLVDSGGRTQVPMIIGEAEASAIQRRMRGERFQRPLTHDLLDSVIQRLGGSVVMVEVDTVRNNAFVSNLVLWDGQQQIRIDSRTSDAVAVALGNDAPIYVSQQVIDATGVPSY